MATAVDAAGTAPTPEPPTAADLAFQRLAGSRPKIRRDVLYTETPGGVLFHNADGGFHLTGRTAYRFASLLVPHLNGEHRLDELCRGLGAPQRATAAELVRTLFERDFARDVPEPAASAEDGDAPPHADAQPESAVAERFAAQIAYLDHYADQAATRFQRFRDTRVAVLGADPVARWCVLSLVRNGLARIGVPADELADRPADGLSGTASAGARARSEAEELTAGGCPVRIEPVPISTGWAELAGYDVVVVSGPDAAVRIHQLLSEGVPEGRTLIPAWTFGNRAVVGPLSTASSGGCWSCALLRLGGNVDSGIAADLWSEVAGSAVGPGTGVGAAAAPGPVIGPLAAMVGNLLGYEVFRLTTGALPAETAGQALIQDLESLDVIAEPVHPHPRCRLCSPATEKAAETGPDTSSLPDALSTPRTPTVETAREAEELVEELGRISSALVRPYTGVFHRYDDEALTQTPLKISTVELALGQGVRRRITAFDVHHLAGARLRALRAAAETYVEHLVPLAGVTSEGSARSLPRLSATALSTGSGVAPESGTAAWTTATSLLTKEPVRVPAAALRPFGPYNRDRSLLVSSAGSGAGGNLAEAAGRGLLSALAHQALLRAVRGRARVSWYLGGLETAADGPRDGADPELVFLRKSARHLGIGVELLDLGESAHSSAHAVLARETGAAGPGRWAVACELTAEAAAGAALRDLLGQAQFTAETGDQADLGDPLLADLAPAAVAVADPAPDTTSGTSSNDTASGTSSNDTASGTSWNTVLDRLRTAGRDVLLVPTTPADLLAGGLVTARVLLTVDPAERVADVRG